jgi:ABC-type Mn2+/Zn2+ transport system ATPase subunit
MLLLDEPTAGIDAAAAQAIARLLVQLHRDRGLTILLVTHDLALARQHLPEIIWVRDGRLEHGPVSQFLTRDKIEQMLELQL